MVVQGHGFWHLMTGYGSYLIFTAAICRSFSFYTIERTSADDRSSTIKQSITKGLYLRYQRLDPDCQTQQQAIE